MFQQVSTSFKFENAKFRQVSLMLQVSNQNSCKFRKSSKVTANFTVLETETLKKIEGEF